MTAHMSAILGRGEGKVAARSVPGLESGSIEAGASCPGGISVEEVADRIAEEMHRRIDLQRALIGRLIAEGRAQGADAACPLVACPRLSRIEEVLRETIDVLEETRSAFKSKRLEVLRKKLTGVLSGR